MVNKVFSIYIKIRAGFFRYKSFFILFLNYEILVIFTLILMLVLAEQYTTESSEQDGESLQSSQSKLASLSKALRARW